VAHANKTKKASIKKRVKGKWAHPWGFSYPFSFPKEKKKKKEEGGRGRCTNSCVKLVSDPICWKGKEGIGLLIMVFT
jgi:hypothetical protein